ncbi:putative helicase senataxin [Acipenser ruthenus]|uniref:Putative helicase senataxin n=1 Tax=Acipenser ruthenus TaxID=7906 RepID=A0A444UWC3_ACIRT|nr:putative helicase senataxin [Acipenser ruthenus]
MGFSLETTEKKEMDAPECLKSFPVKIKQENTETNKQLSIVQCFDTESGSDNEDDVPLMVIKSNLEKKRMFSKEVNQNPLTDSQVDRDLGLLSLTALSKSFSFPVDSSQESSVRQLPDRIERKVRSNVRNIQKAEEEDDLIILENPVIIISDSESAKEDNDLHVGKNKVQQSAKPEPSDVKIAEKDLDRGSSPPLYNEYDSQLFEFETEDEVFSAWDDSQMDNALASPETEQERVESSKKRNSSLEKSPDLNDMYNDWGYDTDYVPDDVIEKAAEHAEKQLMREQESVRVENTCEMSTPVFYGVKRKSSTDISSDMGSKSGRQPDENAMPSTSTTPCLTLAQKLANKRESCGNKVTSKISNFFTSPKAAQNERKATTAASSRSTAVSCKTTSPAIVPPKKVRQREEPKSTAEKLGLKKKERKAFDLSQRSLDCVAELRNYGQHLQVEKQKRRRKSKKCQNTMLISPQKLVVKGNKKLLASQDLQFFRQSRPKKSEQLVQEWQKNMKSRKGIEKMLNLNGIEYQNRVSCASFSVPLHKSDVDRQQYPKEDDLVFLWLPQHVHAYTSEEREVMEPVAHFGCVSGSNVSAAGQNDSKAILYITIKTRGNVSAVHDQPVKCVVIGSLISTLRAFKALYSLRNNVMARAILGPHVSFFRPGQENKVANLSILEYNDEQQKAINSAIAMVKQPQRTPKICLIHGPPGTGKTKTIVGLLESIFSEDQENSIPVENRRLKGRKPRVLLCAPSNAAVDHLMKKIILDFKEKSRDHKNPLGNCGDINLVRLGMEKAISKDLLGFSLDNQTKIRTRNCGDINLVRLGMEKAISKDLLGFSLDNQTKIRTQRGQTVQDTNIYRRKEDLDQQIDNLSRQCAMHQKVREKFQQLTDEKCRLLREREQLGRQLKETRSRKQEVQARVLQDAHVICCTLSTSGSILLESAFRRLGHDPFSCVIVDEAGQATEMETLIPLTYRCPALVLVGDPEQLPPTVISQKAREKRYDQSLMARLWKCLHRETKQNPGIQTPINFLSTQYRMHPDICEFPSKYIYKRALKTDGDTAEKRCGTSWPFQPYRLFDVTDGYETKAGEFVEVDTVDGFQGREKDCIIVSCVRASNTQGSIGFLGNRQRLNVTITRAKCSLFILGHLKTLMDHRDWGALIQDAHKRGTIIKTREKDYKTDAVQIFKPEPGLLRSFSYPPVESRLPSKPVVVQTMATASNDKPASRVLAPTLPAANNPTQVTRRRASDTQGSLLAQPPVPAKPSTSERPRDPRLSSRAKEEASKETNQPSNNKATAKGPQPSVATTSHPSSRVSGANTSTSSYTAGNTPSARLPPPSAYKNDQDYRHPSRNGEGSRSGPDDHRKDTQSSSGQHNRLPQKRPSNASCTHSLAKRKSQ